MFNYVKISKDVLNYISNMFNTVNLTKTCQKCSQYNYMLKRAVVRYILLIFCLMTKFFTTADKQVLKKI